MRLIDADALAEKLEGLAKRYAEQGRRAVAEDYNFVITVLDTAPKVDAIIVGRCGDCAYWDKESIWCGFFHEQKCHDEYCFHCRPEKGWERFTLDAEKGGQNETD